MGPQTGSCPHVLVVDDDPIALEVARERLARAGYEVSTRKDALGTSSWIAANTPDIVLLDVMMPALSGTELARFLKAKGLLTAVILHSSMEQERLEPLVMLTDAVGGIKKTSDDRAFLMEFRRIVARLPELEAPPSS